MTIPESGIEEFRYGPSRQQPMVLFAMAAVASVGLIGWATIGKYGLGVILIALGLSIVLFAGLVGPHYLRNRLVRRQSLAINFAARTLTVRHFCHNDTLFHRRDACVEFSFDDIRDVRLVEGRASGFSDRRAIRHIELRKIWMPASLYVTTVRGHFIVSNAIDQFELLAARLRDIAQESDKSEQLMGRQNIMILVAFGISMALGVLIFTAIKLGLI